MPGATALSRGADRRRLSVRPAVTGGAVPGGRSRTGGGALLGEPGARRRDHHSGKGLAGLTAGWRTLTAVLASCLAVLALPSQVTADATVVSSTPRPGANLASTPSLVTL